MSKTTCVIVTYNSASVITACLDRIPPDIPIVIIDNASTDDTLKRIELTERNPTVINLDHNLGFARAANRGLDAVATQFAFLVSPDAWPEPGAIAALEAAVDQFPDRAIFAPAVLDERGRLQSNYAETKNNPAAQSNGADVAAPSGCALFYNLAALRPVGLFDEAFFLYFEERDLCQRAAAEGLMPRYVPQAQVIHLTGKSSADSDKSKRLAHYEWSHAYFLKKHQPAQTFDQEIQKRHQQFNRKALFYRFLSPGKKGKEFRWRRFGIEAFLNGLSADDLQIRLNQADK